LIIADKYKYTTPPSQERSIKPLELLSMKEVKPGMGAKIEDSSIGTFSK
jgi:hypothetical protein